MRSTSDGALRPSALSCYEQKHGLTDDVGSKKQRRALAHYALGRVWADYGPAACVSLWSRGPESLAKSVKRSYEEHTGWVASVSQRKFTALISTCEHGLVRKRKEVLPVFAISHMAPRTAQAGEKVRQVRGSGTGRSNEALQVAKRAHTSTKKAANATVIPPYFTLILGLSGPCLISMNMPNLILPIRWLMWAYLQRPRRRGRRWPRLRLQQRGQPLGRRKP